MSMEMFGADAGTYLFWFAAVGFAGTVGGLLAGLLGVGGGIVIVPVLYHIFSAVDVAEPIRMKVAVATSLATIIATSSVSIRSHYRRGAVDDALLRMWWLPILVGVVCGTIIGGYVNGRVLSLVFAVVALLVAVRMMLSGKATAFYDGFPNAFAKWLTGILVGLISALMGIGGGTLSVPILSAFGFDIRRAVGTAAAIGFIIAIPGTLGYIISGWNAPDLPPFSLGYLNWAGALVLVPLTMAMAPLGARLAHSIPRRALQVCFAVFLAASSLRMFYDLI
ncbi:MAG: sulfite exporter TauE/SafE family protein [Aquamicrobium sp.]|uniref:sulfite exporter TauE/SafE family protein n=1 Tax=Aquamicrobium sp. TaxID=1872579 RepID=UPI00349E5506|nr:sulfite exporter TauE/SafE family protein [Aquamicrobium sp.]